MADTPDPTESALLRAVCDAPDCDTPRLVYADWLDENGRAEYAEFIRDMLLMSQHTDCPVRLADLARGRPVPLRCGACDYCQARRRANWFYGRHQWVDYPAYAGCLDPTPLDGPMPDGPGLTLVIRRGFVSEVRCTLAQWCGGPHPECGGSGVVVVGPSRFATCPNWDGVERLPLETSCTLPPLAAVAGGWPLEAVRVDRVAEDDGQSFGACSWYALARPNSWEIDEESDAWRNDSPEYLPGSVAKHLPGHWCADGGEMRWTYPTRDEADSALSLALIAFARDARSRAR